MTDIKPCLEQAEATLDRMIEDAAEAGNEHEEIRLRGKREGVQLALSYLRADEKLAAHRAATP